MNNLIRLVKLATAMYQAWRLKDVDLMDEIILLAGDVPKSKESLVQQDKKTEAYLRKLLGWIREQPEDSNIITSLLSSKVAEIILLSPELEKVLGEAFVDGYATEDARHLIFQIIKELRDVDTRGKFSAEFRSMVRPILFEGEQDLSKDDWIKMGELISEKINDMNENTFDKAVVEATGSDNPEGIASVIDQLKVEISPEGIIKTGLAGLNEALYPDCGIRRGLMYMIEALTNRGKSFGLAHLIASVPLYNKPILRNKTKIPTVVLMSAEDSLGLIFKRMYELFVTAKTGTKPDFFKATTNEVVTTIIETFEESGWAFKFYRVNPSHDNIHEIMQRIRTLELKGHEIIVAAYDYLAMADLSGCQGESRSDKLQNLYNRARNFFTSRGAALLTPHQLNPEAKKFIREQDDDSEAYFIRDVGGKSMTEGSTKLTNEVDCVIGFHVAKMQNNENFFTYYVGKMRGEGAMESNRFGIYPLDPHNGLVHDVNFEKKIFRKSLSHRSEAMGGGSDFDDMEA
ncbi:putative DNAB-like replicative helicase [Pseudomonas phage OBP]|uniref:DnaB-like replicative helicase n=1 Tax=Pseudomonas phage OBP TaxID=1124849 RepID=UPI000240D4A8|nr:DnaB-like replicative helicase [Pseudomonas phage OBP]AEV89559.1 putative DNAB-like replicative helicase [Pseudomonas phage OBP]